MILPLESLPSVLFFFLLFFLLFLCFCLVLVGLGFELRALSLQSRCFTTWATPPVHFALVILEMGVLSTSCPSWLQTTILPISDSQIAKITGVSYQCWVGLAGLDPILLFVFPLHTAGMTDTCHPAIGWDRGSWTFSSSARPQTNILLISTS
jgi:hypothetical protein